MSDTSSDPGRSSTSDEDGDTASTADTATEAAAGGSDPDGASGAGASGTGASEGGSGEGGGPTPGERAVGVVLGADLTVRFGPEVIEFLAAYVGLLRVLPDPGTAESIILFGFALGYSDLAWGVGWAVLAVIAVVYVPSLVRPGRPNWPGRLRYRVGFAVPVLGAGLLAEAAVRRLLEQLVSIPPAPVALSVDVRALAAVLVTAVAMFVWAGVAADDDWPTNEYRFPSFVFRGVLLVTILGVFFAEFSLLSPYSEVLAVVLYLLAIGSNRPGDPTERLARGVTTVWGRPGQVAMVLYVTAVLSTVVFVVSTVRFSVPAALFASLLSVSPLFLVVIAGSALFHTYMYGERMLRRFREQLAGSTDPAGRVGGFLGPAAILTSLLLDGYVFGDPMVPPGIVETIVGLYVSLAAVTMIYLPAARITKPPEEAVTVTAGEIDLTKSLSEADEITRVTFTFESSRSDPVDVRLTETLPNWLTPKDIFAHGGVDSGDWEMGRREMVYETTIDPAETAEFQYRLRLQEDAVADQLWNGFTFEVGLDDNPGVEDRARNGGAVDDFAIDDYHLVPVAAGLFVALLGAVNPLEGQYLVPMLLDGQVLALDPVAVSSRFGLLFGLVVLPYVPVGVWTHISYRTSLHERRDAERTVAEERFAAQLTGLAVASSLLFCALVVLIADVPAIDSLWETRAIYCLLILSGGVAVWMGSFEETVSQIWIGVRTVLKSVLYLLLDLFLPLLMLVISADDE